VLSRAIIPGVRGKLFAQSRFLGPLGSKFGNRITEPKFYIRFSPQQDRSKLRKFVIWIEWLKTFQNKLLGIFKSFEFSGFCLIRNLCFTLRFYL